MPFLLEWNMFQEVEMLQKRIMNTKPLKLFLLCAGLMLIYSFGGALLYGIGSMKAYVIGRFLFGLLCLFLFLKVRKGNRLVNEKRPWYEKPTLCAVFLIIFIGLYMLDIFDVIGNISALLRQSRTSIITNTLLALTAGIFEETLFRGFGADTFAAWYKGAKHPLCWSALWTSLIFGLCHLGNMDGTNNKQVLIQVFYAVMLGLALFACRLLSNGMGLPAVLHFLIDLQPDLMSRDVAAGPFYYYVLVFLPIALLAFWTVFQLEKKMKGKEYGI